MLSNVQLLVSICEENKLAAQVIGTTKNCPEDSASPRLEENLLHLLFSLH